MLVSPTTNLMTKKAKVDPSSGIARSDFAMPLVAHGYNLDAKPSSFAHFLGDLILLQSMEGHSAKNIKAILDDSAGYSFRVSSFPSDSCTLLLTFPPCS